MPTYSASPFAPLPQLLQAGKPEYSFGSYSDIIPPTYFYVTSSSETSGNVISIVGKIWQGPIPTTSQTITTASLTNVANVTNQAITTVTGFTTGDLSSGTISYTDPTSAGTIASAPDFSLAIIPQVEVLEAPAATTVARSGLPFALPPVGAVGNARSIAWTTLVSGGTVSAVSFVLQGAIDNIDAQYNTLDTSTNTAGETRVWTPVSQVNFVRVKATITYTGSPKIGAKIAI